MNSEQIVFDTGSNQNFVDLEKQAAQLIKDLKQEIEQSKDYARTNELKEKLVQLYRYQGEIKLINKFTVGRYVQNGSSTPGKIMGVRTQNYSCLVDILWDGSSDIDELSPKILKLLPHEELQYIWDGQRFEKLIRKCDRVECSDIEILKSFQQQAEKEYSDAPSMMRGKKDRKTALRQVTYCKKRIQVLSALNIESSTALVEDDKNQPLVEVQLPSSYGEKEREFKLHNLDLTQIRRSPVCQQREYLDLKVVEEYKEVFLSGQKLPSVKVIYDGEFYWLYDGFHTTQAAIEANLNSLRAEVSEGSFRDAILASVGVNAYHGLRRSNQTKRNAVMVLLQDEEWCMWSNREIARRCKVSESLVREIKKEQKISNTKNDTKIITAFKRSDNTKDDNSIMTVNVDSDNPKTYKDKYGNLSKMNVNNIGISTNGHIVSNEVSKDTNSTNFRKEFFPNQLCQIHLFDLKCADEELKALNHHYCTIEGKSEKSLSYSVRDLETGSVLVAMASDLRAVESVSITITFSSSEYQELMMLHGNRDGLDKAIKKKLLGDK
jgi:uncharacterized protein (UPF0179 family)